MNLKRLYTACMILGVAMTAAGFSASSAYAETAEAANPTPPASAAPAADVQAAPNQPQPPLQEQAIRVMIDNKLQTYEKAPVIMNGSTLVPMRAIFESLGAFIEWNDTARSVTATKYGQKIVITIGSKSAVVNGQTKQLEQEAVIIDDSTFVPARFVSEALGAAVAWNDATRTVSITTPKTADTGTGNGVPGSTGTAGSSSSKGSADQPPILLKETLPAVLPHVEKSASVPYPFTFNKSWSTFNTKYFQVYYYGNENDIFILSKRFDELYDQLLGKFGNKLTSRIPVYFLAPADYMATVNIDWSSASWSPTQSTMFMKLSGSNDFLDDLIVTFKHELTHALSVPSGSLGSIPMWFAEGAATYNEQGAPFYDVRAHRLLNDAYKSKSLVPWKDFGDSNSTWKQEDLGKIYAEAQSIYGFLVEKYGETQVNALFKAGSRFDSSLAALTHRTLKELESDWLAYLNEKMAKDASYYGILYYEAGSRYEGDIKHGLPGGKGKLYDKYQLVYEGEFKEGKFNGTGVYYFNKGGRYEGTFVSGQMEGAGRIYDQKGALFYDGQMKNDKYEGFGRIYYKDGTDTIYEGNFSRGEPNGKGQLLDKDGKVLQSFK
jgi:hypothetical protein